MTPTRTLWAAITRAVLREDQWTTPDQLAAELSTTGLPLPSLNGTTHVRVNADQVASLLRTLRRTGHAINRDGAWARTPAGSRAVSREAVDAL